MADNKLDALPPAEVAKLPLLQRLDVRGNPMHAAGSAAAADRDDAT
jgi:hypothetical protein